MQLINEKYINILSQVFDPEIPVLTIVDLGIVKEISETDDALFITIIPTYTGCPAMDMIAFDIKKVFQNNGFNDVTVNISLSPPWSTDMISEAGLVKLKEYGIAPPVEKSTDKSHLINGIKIVGCPRCNSNNTEMISLFGSTACKSLYKCLECLEPFDYFKCH